MRWIRGGGEGGVDRGRGREEREREERGREERGRGGEGGEMT